MSFVRLVEHFPDVIEKELKQVKINVVLDEFKSDMLKDEIGRMMFGDMFNQFGLGNPELPSRQAGELGKEVKKWKDKITEQIIDVDKLPSLPEFSNYDQQ